MMGVGFAVGFAQSHFEITAIAASDALLFFSSGLSQTEYLHA